VTKARERDGSVLAGIDAAPGVKPFCTSELQRLFASIRTPPMTCDQADSSEQKSDSVVGSGTAKITCSMRALNATYWPQTTLGEDAEGVQCRCLTNRYRLRSLGGAEGSGRGERHLEQRAALRGA
jgi:hypothetical protein